MEHSSPNETILVVAPSEDLRRSIAFALEAEGYTVIAASELPGPAAVAALPAIACAVIDEWALDMRGSGRDRAAQMGQPIILLTNGLRNVPTAFAYRVLTKPLLGRTLLDAVAESLAAGRVA